tara:strand:- start:584 stop:754 length:171 start_codon:yes stop_codon:yes gene_type:complete
MDDKKLNEMPEDEEASKRVLEESLFELEKSFGLGSARKSRIVSRGFTLNEIVKDSK